MARAGRGGMLLSMTERERDNSNDWRAQAARDLRKNLDPKQPVHISSRGGGGGLKLIVILVVLLGGGWYAWGQGWLGFIGLKAGDAPAPPAAVSELTGVKHTVQVLTDATGVTCRYAVGKARHREVPAPCTIKVKAGEMLDLKVTRGDEELLRKMFNVDVDEVYRVEP